MRNHRFPSQDQPPPFDPWTAFLPPRTVLETPPPFSRAGGSRRPPAVDAVSLSSPERPRPGRPLPTRRCVIARRTFSFACNAGVKTREVPVALVPTAKFTSILVVVRLHAIATVAFTTLAVVVQEAARSQDDPGTLFLGADFATISLPTAGPALRLASRRDPPPEVQVVVRSSDFTFTPTGFQVASLSIDLIGRFQ